MKAGFLPPLLLRSGLRHQLTHRWQTLLALSGIIMGVAIVLAVDLANSAAKASFQLSSAQLRGTATHRLVSQTDQLPQSLYQKLYTSPNHPPLAPVITARVTIENAPNRYQLVGIDVFAESQFRPQWFSEINSNGNLSEWLTDPSALIISHNIAEKLGLTINDPIKVIFQQETFELKIFELNRTSKVGANNLFIADIATVQAITGRTDRLSQIDLILSSQQDIDWIKQRLPESVQLIDITQQTNGVVRLSEAFELNLTAMSLLALMVGLFLIFNAMSFSIVQRRNLFGRLRALGVFQFELYRLLLAEALVLGIIGTLFGVLLGQWLGKELTGIVAETVSQLYYQVSADAMQMSGFSLVKAIILGIGGTLLATLIPAFLAARIPPLTTLSRAALEKSSKQLIPLLGVIGCLMLGMGLMIAFLLPGGILNAFIGLFIALLGCALMTPSSLLLAQWLLARIPLSGIWRMATRDMDRHLSRLATAAAALMVALCASVGVSIMVSSMQSSVSDWLKELLNADVYIAAQGFEQGSVLKPEVLAIAQKMEYLSDISLYRNTRITLDNRSVRLVGARLAKASRAGYQILAGNPATVWDQYDQGSIFISEPLANRLKLGTGDKLTLPTLKGKTSFTIAAVLRDYSSEHGRIYMPLKVYRYYWDDDTVNTMAIFSNQLAATDLMQYAQSYFGWKNDLVFTDARAIYDESMGIFERTFRITEVLRLLSMLVAFIGILTALMAIQLERRKEFAVLRALGLTRLQVSQLIVIESLQLGLVSAFMAIPAGIAMAWVLTDSVQLRAFGWSMPLQITASPLWMTLLLGLLAAFIASLYPAWHASRHNPAGQLRED